MVTDMPGQQKRKRRQHRADLISWLDDYGIKTNPIRRS